MHARWDFDASSARTRRVSALDKHQNWSASAIFCHNSWEQSKYAAVNLIHTWRTQTFCLLLCDKYGILVSLKSLKYYQQNKITRIENESTQRSRKSTLRDAHAHVSITFTSVLCEVFGVQLYKNNARALLSCILSIPNSDWLQHARSVPGVYMNKSSNLCIDLILHSHFSHQWTMLKSTVAYHNTSPLCTRDGARNLSFSAS